jgi:hypothetical protein
MPLFMMVKERIIKNWSCDKPKRNINHEKNKLIDLVGFNSSIKILDIKEKVSTSKPLGNIVSTVLNRRNTTHSRPTTKDIYRPKKL